MKTCFHRRILWGFVFLFLFRCPPLFDLLVRVLMGYLAGSRALLSQYLQAHPASRTEGLAVEQEREELRAALVTAQESAAIQILLEVCVKTAQDQVSSCNVEIQIIWMRLTGLVRVALSTSPTNYERKAAALKREIRHFHVAFVQRRPRNEQKSVMHVQSCCCTDSRCRSRRCF